FAMSNRAATIGLFALALNFATLKWLSYYPVLTDSTALTFGVLALYAFRKRSTLGLFLIGSFGFFVWPTAPYLCLMLTLFSAVPAESEASRFASPPAWLAIRVIVTCIAAGFMLLLAVTVNDAQLTLGIRHLPGLLVSTVLTTGATWIALSAMRGALPDNLPACAALTLLRAMPLLGFIAIHRGIQALYFYTPATALTPWTALASFVYWSSIEPFISIVAHASYFGPIVVLLVMVYRRACARAAEVCTPMVLVIVFTLFMGLDSESRHLIMIYPFIVLATCLCLDAINLSDRFI